MKIIEHRGNVNNFLKQFGSFEKNGRIAKNNDFSKISEITVKKKDNGKVFAKIGRTVGKCLQQMQLIEYLYIVVEMSL